MWSVSAIESAYREDRAEKFFCAMLAGDSVLDHCSCRAGALNLYSLIYSLANSNVKFTPKYFLKFSLLQIPIVIGKNVNFLQTKFTPKAGQIYPWLGTPAVEEQKK